MQPYVLYFLHTRWYTSIISTLCLKNVVSNFYQFGALFHCFNDRSLD